MRKPVFRLIIFSYLCLFLSPLSALTGGNLYRILMDERGEAVRLVFVRSLREKEPVPFLINNLAYEDPAMVHHDKSTVIYERKSFGRIPVLCFHRIGEDSLYELSLDRVHQLFTRLKQAGYYPMNDLDFARGDFSHVPSGMKPIVLGADDAGDNQLLWDEITIAAYRQGSPRDFTLDPDCFASIFKQYFNPSQGRYNFTFYVSFDAIPFRQIAGQSNPGFPYEKIPIIADKMKYADEYFNLGYHGLSHTFREKLKLSEFISELKESDRIMSDYLGYQSTFKTLAYPYGSGSFSPKEERAYAEAVEQGKFPEFAYDLNGKFSISPWSDNFRSWDISRFSVENKSFPLLMNLLDSPSSYRNRRTILIRSLSKDFDLDDYHLNLGEKDIVYVYIP